MISLHARYIDLAWTHRSPLQLCAFWATTCLALLLTGSALGAQVAVPVAGDADQAGYPRQRAARALQQTTFGATPALLDQVTASGFEPWLSAQFEEPPTWHEPRVVQLLAEVESTLLSHPDLASEPPEVLLRLFLILGTYTQPAHRYAWWQAAMTAPDQLRQRVAFALSEIFVVSDELDFLERRPQALASYYDVLVRHAFGNYRDLLREVTLHPAMGIYLSHFNNSKSDPNLGIYPDENYAREVMQLFSIGLDELNRDGSPKLDSAGERIPTYTNAQITEMAKIFTGLGPGEPFGRFGGRTNGTVPMRMYEAFHEPGPKQLLNGFVVPAGQTGMQDIEAAVDNLFQHPNVAPFVCRRLIQRLVTSNPSPEYLDRIAQVFEDNGSGVRGDLAATVRALLLDPEARNGDLQPNLAERAGKLQEPWLRYVGLLRAFGASSASGEFLNTGGRAQASLAQHPLSSPSVFNFFSPDFRPNGPVAAAGLTAPEFQITNSSTVLSVTNFLDSVVFEVEPIQVPYLGLLCLNNLDLCIEAARCDDRDCNRDLLRQLEQELLALRAEYGVTLDLSAETNLATANEFDALIERVGLLIAGGTLSAETRQAVYDAVALLPFPDLRARTAIYLIALSPEAAVAR